MVPPRRRSPRADQPGAPQDDIDWWVMDALGCAAVIHALEDLGMPEALETPVTAQQVAEQLSTDPRTTALLLEAAASLQVVAATDDGRWVAGPGLDAAAFHERMWSALPEAIRSGQAWLDVAGRADAEALYPHVTPLLERIAEPLHARAARRLRGRGARVLDLGAGTAPWSRALAAADPEVRVTAVDLPAVCEGMRAALVADGLDDRFEVVAGDLFTAELGRDFDLVLLAGVCRLFPDDGVATLIGRAGAALHAGGLLAIIDALPDVDRADGDSNAIYALGLSLRAPQGGVHPYASYESWLRRSGLEPLGHESLGVPEASLILGQRARAAGEPAASTSASGTPTHSNQQRSI